MQKRASILAAALAAAALSAPALAAGDGGHGGGSSEGPSNRIKATFTLSSDLEDTGADEGAAEAVGVATRAVIIPTLSMPAFDDDRLKNYLFVNVRIVVHEGVDPWPLREQVPRIRDAMIRAGHRRSIADPENALRIDGDLARDVLREALSQFTDLDGIERIELTNVDTHAS